MKKAGVPIPKKGTVLLCTGHHARTFPTAAYSTDNPGVTVEATEWLAKQGIVHFGIDSMRPGPEGKVNSLVHKACLELDITHMESLCNLEALHRAGRIPVHRPAAEMARGHRLADPRGGGVRQVAHTKSFSIRRGTLQMLLGHNRRMTGAECLADMLKGYGVTHVFHVPAVLRTTFVEMERRTDIKRLHVHGEKAAAYMADGYARASGKPGICMAQVIGALNLAAGLRDAWLAHSPVIAMTGGREPKTKFRKVYQEIDDVPAFEPVTKFNATIDDVARFPDMVRQAFRTAVTGCARPGASAIPRQRGPDRRRGSGDGAAVSSRNSRACQPSGRSRTRRACARR